MSFNREIAGNFTCIEVIFVLKRRLGYYLFHTYIPTCLIVVMSVSPILPHPLKHVQL